MSFDGAGFDSGIANPITIGVVQTQIPIGRFEGIRNAAGNARQKPLNFGDAIVFKRGIVQLNFDDKFHGSILLLPKGPRLKAGAAIRVRDVGYSGAITDRSFRMLLTKRAYSSVGGACLMFVPWV
jgi:hypothetical protein